MLAQWDAPLLVLGAPGTGKTTLLAHAAVAGSAAGGPAPLVLAASRTAASALRNTISAGLGDGSWQPVVTTAHALCRTIWQRFAGRPDLRLLAAPEQEYRVRELLAGSGASHWPAELRPALGTRGFAAQVRAAIARTRQLGLEPEDLAAFGAEAGRPEWAALGGFFAEYLDVLDAEGVLDYAELVHRVRLLLTEPDIAEVLGGEIGSVLIDDYTELDPAQIALLATLAGSAPVLAVADPDSISSTFRGAHPRAVADFERFFGRPDAAARRVELTAGHRSGPVIAEALAGVRARLPRPAGAGLPEVVPADTDAGEVAVFTCSGEADQADTIAAEIRRARLTGGIQYGDMAVLVRSGRRQLGPIIRSLAAAGIPVEVAGDEIPLAQAPSVRPLLLALAVTATGRVEPDEAVRLLTSPLAGFDALGLRRLAREWRAGRATSPAGLPEQLAAAINEPAWLDDTEASPVTARLRRLLDVMAAAARRVRSGDPVDVVAWALWQGTDWPRQLSRESLAGGALGSRADADLDALCALFESAAEADRRGGVGGIRAFLAELAGQQIPADRERESRLRGRGVQVLTAHRARGREWDLVLVAGVQEGVWPVGRRVSTVLEAAALTTDGLTGRADHRDLLAAERRLFHLACSRARRRLVVTAAAGHRGGGRLPVPVPRRTGGAAVGAGPAPATAHPCRHGGGVAPSRHRSFSGAGTARGRCGRAGPAGRRHRRSGRAPGARCRPVQLVGGAGAHQPSRAAGSRPVGAAEPEPGDRHPDVSASLLPGPGGARGGGAGPRCRAGLADPPAGAAGRNGRVGACRAARTPEPGLAPAPVRGGMAVCDRTCRGRAGPCPVPGLARGHDRRPGGGRGAVHP